MSFYKPLLLPSNNIPYNGLIHVKEPDISLLLMLKGSFVNSSEVDLYFSVIKKYTSIEKPEELYFRDIQYIWYYFYTNLNQSDELKIPFSCNFCGNEKTLIIKISDLETKYAKKEDFLEKEININDFTFYFRNRFFGDNIISGITNLESNNKNSIYYFFNFLKPQCTKIRHKNEEFDNEALLEALEVIGLNETMYIFDKIKEENWGLESSFSYTCKNCNNEQKVLISDPFRSSLYVASSTINNSDDLLETLLSVSSFKIISFNELLNLPISFLDPTFNSINKIVKKKFGNNKTDYFDHLREEME
jgi:hypothetical protein